MISTVLIVIGLLGIVLFLVFKNKPASSQTVSLEKKTLNQPIVEVKKTISYGPLYVFYGSQTGTAAKMAENFSQEAQEHGFVAEVLDLKNFEQKHFNGKTICVFFLSNTGEGDAPDNTIEFMKALKGTSDRQISFGKCRFTIFGLGNTQYQYYNKVAKDIMLALAEKHKATPVYKLGLGDNNASLEDDYLDWKTELWPALKKSSQETVVEVEEHVEEHHAATWRFVKSTKTEEFQIGQEFHKEYDLQFLTENLLKSRQGIVTNIIQKRQNTEDGSSLEISIEPAGDKSYGTAQNLVLYPQNDPTLINQIASHFHLDMQSLFDVQFDKKARLPFCTPIKLSTLLRKHIDLQRPVIKNLLLKLSKFPSSNPQYFLDNSSVKSTAEYTRLTSSFNHLFKLVTDHRVELSFETFVSLCDPIAPRFYTIGSSQMASPDAIQIMVSLEENGLCSNFFKTKPKSMRIEVRSSTFDDAMRTEKAVMIGAGVGFAPFRGYLQEKEVLMAKGEKVPWITLYFGSKHENGDFIYREDIKKWIEKGVINKFYPAFSRDQAQKVYVQTRMAEPQAQEQLYQVLNSQTSKLYCCGSTSMGNSVKQSLAVITQQRMNIPIEQSRLKVLALERSGRIIMELW